MLIVCQEVARYFSELSLHPEVFCRVTSAVENKGPSALINSVLGFSDHARMRRLPWLDCLQDAGSADARFQTNRHFASSFAWSVCC